VTPQTPLKRRTVAFLLFGALLVGGAIAASVHFKTELYRNVLIITITAVLTSVVVRIAADVLLQPRLQLQVLQRSDIRSTRKLSIGRKSDSYASPRFFRAPPYLVDFQKRYVVKRLEADTILKHIHLLRRGLIIIQGPQASGKTILLHTIAFDLNHHRWSSLRRRPTYIADLKSLMVDDLAALKSDLERLPRRSVALIDDVHLHPSALGLIAQQLRTKRVLLVFITRPLNNYPREHVASILDMKAVTFNVKADTVASDIVSRFLYVTGVLEQQAAAIAYIYDPYRHDLWALSTALEASVIVQGIPEVSQDAINQWLISKFLRFEQRGERVIDRATVLAPIAALYRFEVTASRDYLTKELGAKIGDLRDLVATGEVVSTTDDFYALHHSSLAELLVHALSATEGGGLVPDTLRAKARSTGLKWQDAAVLWQIESVPLRAIRTLVGASRSGTVGRELALALIQRIGTGAFLDAVQASTTDIETLGSFLELYSKLDELLDTGMARSLRNYVIEAPKENARAWSWLTYNMALIDVDEALLFADVLAKILRVEAVATVADVGTTLSYVSPVIASRALTLIDMRAMADSLSREELPAEEVAKIFAKLVWVDATFASTVDASLLELFPAIDATTLPVLLSRVAWGSPDVARRLLENCQSEALSGLLIAAETVATRYRALAAMANVSLKVARSLVQYGNLDRSVEVGVHELVERVLDQRTKTSSDVLASFCADFPPDPLLSEARDAIRGAVAPGNDVSTLAGRLAALSDTVQATSLLQMLPTVIDGLRAEQNEPVAIWAKRLLVDGGADDMVVQAYLRCTCLEEESS
jgi:hypothetical protein